MFDFFKNSILVKIFLAVIALSLLYFGFSGVGSFKGNYLVQIGDTRIHDFDVKSYLQRTNQPQDEEHLHQGLIDLQKRAYLIEGSKLLGIEISGKQVGRLIQKEPAFRNGSGHFDQNKYQEFINNTYKTEALFAQELKNNLLFNLVDYLISQNHIISNYQLLQYLSIYKTVKKWQEVPFLASDYQDKVVVNDQALHDFYSKHKDSYALDAAVQYEYLYLTPEKLMNSIKVAKEEIQNYWRSNKLGAPKRLVSHIVFAFPSQSLISGEGKAAIKKQALGVLAAVRARPELFSLYAAKYSQDRATAQIGGSLGLIEQNGQYYLEIEKAAFAAPVGKVYKDLVETKDGYHIIEVNAEMNWKDYQQDKPGIAYVLKYNKAKDELTNLSEGLSEVAFNDSKNLSRVSEKELGNNLTQESAGWVTKKQAIVGGLPPEVIETLFDSNSIKDKTNSDVINVGNQYWIVRVKAYRPARQQSFIEVKEQVERDYRLMQSHQLALEAARHTLAVLQQGKEVTLNWSKQYAFTLEEAKLQLPLEDYRKLLETGPGNYYLVEKRTNPVLVWVEEEVLQNPNDQEKLKLSFDQSHAILTKKNKVALLSYLQKHIKRYKGDAKLMD